jgi:hypothetical protein
MNLNYFLFATYKEFSFFLQYFYQKTGKYGGRFLNHLFTFGAIDLSVHVLTRKSVK